MREANAMRILFRAAGENRAANAIHRPNLLTEEPTVTPDMTVDRSDITVDRTDITVDQTIN